MKYKVYEVNAFTDTKEGGNPAGVVVNADGLSSRTMQSIAKKMALSETAFIIKGKDTYDYELRFFTPLEEVDLCGHATIASFNLLRDLGLLNKNQIIQKTKAGLLNVQVSREDVSMEQGKAKFYDIAIDKNDLCKIMGLDPSSLGVELLAVPEIWSTGLKDILLPVQSLEVLKNLNPDMEKLSKLSRDLDLIGVHAFTIKDGQVWCRNFAPACGIPEESATGTSNGALGACLHSKSQDLNKPLSFTAFQGYWMGSPSQIRVHISKDSVMVGGKAILIKEVEIEDLN